MKQKLVELKGKIDNSVITVGDLSTALSVISRISRQMDENSEDLAECTSPS